MKNKKTHFTKEFKSFFGATTKRFYITFMICLIVITFITIFGPSPSVYAQVEGGSDFKDIEGCFYSLTPSTYGDFKDKTLSKKTNGQTKYCYTLVDEGSDDANYKYLTDDKGDVYAFEYYTYLEDDAKPTNKIAVYSHLQGLSSKVLSDGTKVYFNSVNPEMVYKDVSDYLYYYLKEFTPQWVDTGLIKYSPAGSLNGKDDSNNSFNAYEYADEDLYQQYANIDVITKYMFTLGEDTVFYDAVTYDENTDTIRPLRNGETIKVDGSVYQITVKDLDAITYVLQREGSSYVTTDINGKEEGEEGFSTQSYFKGGIIYVYNSEITLDTENGSQIVSGFEMFKVTDETRKFDELKDYIASDGYSLITFDASNQAMIEAIRYYNLFEIEYQLVETINDKHQSNKSGDDIENSKTANIEFIYDNNGNPTAYRVKYSYTIVYQTGLTYDVTYKSQQYQYDEKTYKYGTDTTYEFTYIGESTTKSTKLTDNEIANLGNYSNNQLFYKGVESRFVPNGTYAYSIPSATQSVSYSEKSTNYQYYSTGIGNSGWVTSNIEQSTGTYTNSNLGQSSYSYYNFNGTLYKTKQSREVTKNVTGWYKYTARSTADYSLRITETNGGEYTNDDVDQYSFQKKTSGSISKGNVGTQSAIITNYENYLRNSETVLVKTYILKQTGEDLNDSKNKKSTDNVGNLAKKLLNENNSGTYTIEVDNGKTHKAGGFIGIGQTTYYHYNRYELVIKESVNRILVSRVESEADSGSCDLCHSFWGNWRYNDQYVNIDYIPSYGFSSYEHYYASSEPKVANYVFTATRYTTTITKENMGTSTNYAGYTQYANVTDMSGSNMQSQIGHLFFEDYPSSVVRESLGKDYVYYQPYTTSVYDYTEYYYSDPITLTTYTYNFSGNTLYYTLDIQSDSSSIDTAFNNWKNTSNIEASNPTIKNSVNSNASRNGMTAKINSFNYTVTRSATSSRGDTKTDTFIVTFPETTININQKANGNTQTFYQTYKLSISTGSQTQRSYVGTKSVKTGLTKQTMNVWNNVEESKSSTITRESVFKYVKTDYINKMYYTNEQIVDWGTEITLTQDVDGDIRKGYANNKYRDLTGENNNKWRMVSSIENRSYTTYNFDFTQEQPNTTDYSTTSSNAAYYVTRLGKHLNQTIDTAKIKSHTEKMEVTNLYSGILRTHNFTVSEKRKSNINNGSSSNNFGTNNVVVDSYYSNVSFNGTIPVGSAWNGSYELPKSYNQFNEAAFIRDLTQTGNYVRTTTGSDGYKVYTLKAPVTINAYSLMCSSKGTPYTVSYYLNGTRVSQTFTYKGTTQSYSVKVGEGLDSYTLSKIEINEGTEALAYTPYVSISVNQENPYREEFIGHKANISKEWRDTEYTYASKIANLSELINQDGSWNDLDVLYSLFYDGKYDGTPQSFSYTNDGYYATIELGNGLRLTYKTSKDLYYVTEREIVIVTGEYDNYLDVTKNKDNVDSTYYYKHFADYLTDSSINTKATVKTHDGNYLPIDTIAGKLRLLEIKQGVFFGDVYARYVADTDTTKLVRTNGVDVRKYNIYQDQNKTSTDGGKTFTYNSEGYNHIVDGMISNDNIVKISDIITHLKPETEAGTSISASNIFDYLVKNNSNAIKMSKTDRDNLQYNSYSKVDKDSLDTVNTDIEYLLLSSKTLDRTKEIIYVDALTNNHYKLFDATERISNVNGIHDAGYTLYDEYELVGSWKHIEDMDEFVMDSSVEKKPEIVKVSNNEKYPYIETVYKIDDLFFYKLSSTDSRVPDDLKGKLIAENIGLFIRTEKDGTLNLVYADNLESDYAKASSINYLNNMERAYTYNQDFINVSGDTLNAKVYLKKTQKVNMYYYLKSQNYILDYYTSEFNVDNFGVIDMRYQFTSMPPKVEFNKNTPTVLYGDDLANPTIYSLYSDTTKNLINSYNYVIAASQYQGGLKAGYILNGGEKVAEKIYYNDAVYFLGNTVKNGESIINAEDYYALVEKVVRAYYEKALEKYNAARRKYDADPSTMDGITSCSGALMSEFLAQLTLTYNDMLNHLGDSNKVKDELNKIYGKNYTETNKNSALPLLDLTSSMIQVNINVNDGTIETNNYYKNQISTRSKSQHYIQLGGYIYYRYENSSKAAMELNTVKSYLGVDLAMDSPQSQYTSSPDYNGNALKKFLTQDLADIAYGASLLDFMNLDAFNQFANCPSADNILSSDLATCAYSGFVNTASSSGSTGWISTTAKNNVAITDFDSILNKNVKTYYFIEVISSNGEASWANSVNSYPFAEVEYGHSYEKHICKGFKTFNLSGDKASSRYIISDTPARLVISQAPDIQSFLSSGLFQGNTNKIKLYWSNKDITFKNGDLSNGNDEIKFGNVAINDDEGDLWAEIRNGFDSFMGDNFSSELSRYRATDKLGGTYDVVGGMGSGKVEILNQDMLTAFDNIFKALSTKNVVGWFEKTVITAAKNLWNWLTGKKIEKLPSLFAFNYRILTFSNYKTANEIGVSDEFSISTSLTDTDYTSATSFKVTINDISRLETPSVYAYSLYYRPKDINVIGDGFELKGNTAYFMDKSATSHLSSDTSIKNVIQQSSKAESYSITGLPADELFTIAIYTAKTANYGTEAKVKKESNIYFDKSVTFTTGSNLVNNPFGIKKTDRKVRISDLTHTGNNYLYENDQIDYEVAKFIYGQTNLRHPASSIENKADDIYIFTRRFYQGSRLEQKELSFSGRYLMQKYLETENVSKIAFGLAKRNVNNLYDSLLYVTNAKVKIFSHKQNKYVLGTTSNGVLLDTASGYQGMFYYDLTADDKEVLKTKYKNDLEKFVNDYLLNDNFEFSFNGLFNKNMLDDRFSIVWQPYYEKTMMYLNLNQSFLDKDASKPTYDGINDIGYDAYDVNGYKIRTEAATYVQANYAHIQSTNSGLAVIYNTSWTVGLISLTDVNGKKFSNYFELAIVQPKNWASEYMPLWIVTQGEAHITS